MPFEPLSFKEPVNRWVEQLVTQYGDTLHGFSALILQGLLLPIEQALRAAPAWLILLLVLALAWHATRSLWRAGALTAALSLIGLVGLWDALMQTLAITLVATGFTVLIGLPLGILMARYARLRAVLLPLLDVMQTLPSFVYLIPVLMLFGLGKVPAIMATLVYALPPLMRLTDLGIRQVNAELLEAAWSFGTTPWQLLVSVQLPQALPSIMAGINQCLMMALSMVVIASMIGARGLGEEVLTGIQTLDFGRGLQAGLAIVILAIVLDRITQAYGVRAFKETPGRSQVSLAPSGGPGGGVS